MAATQFQNIQNMEKEVFAFSVGVVTIVDHRAAAARYPREVETGARDSTGRGTC